MQAVMSVQETRAYEAYLAEQGIPADELMRRAGAVVALQAAQLVRGGSVLVLCGPGNNGGDAWVCADHLARHGYSVHVVSAVEPTALPPVAGHAARRAREMGIPVFISPSDSELLRLVSEADVVVDGCFGIGFHGALPAPYDHWARITADFLVGAVVSIDIPSGINATTGRATGPTFTASHTVTMFAAKPGLLQAEGRQASGTIVVAGLVPAGQGLKSAAEDAEVYALESSDYAGIVPDLYPGADKYSRGRVLVVGGSVRYPGAAIMAALAAARSGAGYVTLAVPEPVRALAQTHLLTIPVIGLSATSEGTLSAQAATRVAELARHADAVVCGCGLETGGGTDAVVKALLGTDCTLLLDADGINAAARLCLGSAVDHPQPLRRRAPLVLTPHRRELARLAGTGPEGTSTLGAAIETSKRLVWSVGSSNILVLAKGDSSAVTSNDSSLIFEAGSPALATAGTGDVLAGLCGSVLAQVLALPRAAARDQELDQASSQKQDQTGTQKQEQGSSQKQDQGSSQKQSQGTEQKLTSPEDTQDSSVLDPSTLLMALAYAGRVHALAGDLAAEERSVYGVIATDVIDKLGPARIVLMEQAAEGQDSQPGSQLEEELDFEDESRVEQALEVRAERLAAATAHSWAADDGDLEEPEDPEEQQQRLEREQRAAIFLRTRAARRSAPVPSTIQVPVDDGLDEPGPYTPASPGTSAAASAAAAGADAQATSAAPAVSAAPASGAAPAPVSAPELAQPAGPAGVTTQFPAVQEAGAQRAAATSDAANDSQDSTDATAGQDSHAEPSATQVLAVSTDGPAAPESEPNLPPFLKRPPRTKTAGTTAPAPAAEADAEAEEAQQSTGGSGTQAAEPQTRAGSATSATTSDGPQDQKSAADAEPQQLKGNFATSVDPELSVLEEFHKRATRHAGGAPGVPPQARPEARRRKK